MGGDGGGGVDTVEPGKSGVWECEHVEGVSVCGRMKEAVDIREIWEDLRKV